MRALRYAALCALAPIWLLGAAALSGGRPINPAESAPASRQLRVQSHNSSSSGRPATAVDRVAALLSTRPRGSAAASGPPATGQMPNEKTANSTAPRKPHLKRQVDQLDSLAGTSRRAEDPWFLDQAPLPLQPYRFAYDVKDRNGLTEQYRQEAGDGKFLTGSYGYVLPDGIYRHVDYVADDRGFRAFIRTSEPGTANQNPANVVINSNPVAQPAVGRASGQLEPYNLNGAVWNYSQAPTAYSSLPVATPLNFAARTLEAGLQREGISELTRRPPGSIVGTPVRNFSSLAYAPAAHFGQLAPTTSAHSNLNLLANQPANFESARGRSGNLTGDSWARLKSEELANRFGPSSFLTTALERNKSERESSSSTSASRDPSSIQLALSAGLGPAGARDYFSHSFAPARVGPTVLLYDRPLTSGSQAHPKLSYDTGHVLHPDSAYLALERAHKLSSLEQFNSRLGQIRAPHTELSLPGGLKPIELSPSPPSQTTTTATITSHNSEQHRQHEQHSSREFVDEANRNSVRNEHKSGSSSAFSGSRQSASGGDSQQLLAPPQPQFQSTFSARVDHDGGGAVKGHQRGQHQQHSRLLAPYAGYLQQQQGQDLAPAGGVKGGQQQQQSRMQETFGPVAPSSPAPPDEPRPPREPEPPASGSTKSWPSTQSPDSGSSEIDLQPPPSSKSPAARTVRMPEDYRTGRLLAMSGDVRSMQNSFGLPQPPRLQRPSFAPPLALADRHEWLGAGLKLADQIVASRMSRADELLGGSRGHSAPQQASVQQSVAVPAGAGELAKQTPGDEQRPPASGRRAEERSRSLSTGPVVRSEATGGEFSAAAASNETFEAQRLSANKAKNLARSDKLTELEKFQQRLRSQQQLLEQIKSSPGDSAPNKAAGLVMSRLGVSSKASGGEPANSHVKYDEPTENELVGGRPERPELARRDFGRIRRENETEGSPGPGESGTNSSRPAESAATTTTRAPSLISELARQIQRWPAVLGQNRTTPATERKLLHVHKLESGTSSNYSQLTRKRALEPEQQNELAADRDDDKRMLKLKRGLELEGSSATKPTTGNSSGSSAAKNPNTINLDFINSVTALSMDQLNPFAIASVNPAIQLGGAPQIQSPSSDSRLSSHRLAISTPSNSVQSAGGFVATSAARYFSSPELLAALDHHERRDTSGQLASLLAGHTQDSSATVSQNGAQSEAKQRPGGGLSNLLPTNHRHASELAGTPYMLRPPQHETGAAVGSGGAVNSLGAKFVVGPASSPAGALMSAAANSQHRTLAPLPTSRVDGFEVRDRPLQVDNHRFFEVVSASARQPSESTSANFQAFRGEFARRFA